MLLIIILRYCDCFIHFCDGSKLFFYWKFRWNHSYALRWSNIRMDIKKLTRKFNNNIIITNSLLQYISGYNHYFWMILIMFLLKKVLKNESRQGMDHTSPVLEYFAWHRLIVADGQDKLSSLFFRNIILFLLLFTFFIYIVLFFYFFVRYF